MHLKIKPLCFLQNIQEVLCISMFPKQSFSPLSSSSWTRELAKISLATSLLKHGNWVWIFAQVSGLDYVYSICATEGPNFYTKSGFTSHLDSLEIQDEAFILRCLSFSTCKMNVKKVASQIEYQYEVMLL